MTENRTESVDEHWMREALKASVGARLIAPPNPAVGCVIVKDGREIARGFTQAPGSAHAESQALNAAAAAGESVVGATVYVTLEPCSHYGRTPPCALRLIKERVGRVVAAVKDPNTLVAGRGLNMLKDAGIDVVSGVCEAEAVESNIGFLTRMKRGTPWVRMKLAASLDGRTALENGESRWITSEASREDGRLLRAYSQGILTGVGTVKADDPQMNVRLPGDWKDPVKFVCDAKASMSPAAKILQGAPCVVFVGMEAPEAACRALRNAGADVVTVAEVEPGRLDMQAVLSEIGRREVNVLHVEAGARLSGDLIRRGLVDELVLYAAPALMGHGKKLAELPHFDAMSEVLRWEFKNVTRSGDDLKLVLRPKRG